MKTRKTILYVLAALILSAATSCLQDIVPDMPQQDSADDEIVINATLDELVYPSAKTHFVTDEGNHTAQLWWDTKEYVGFHGDKTGASTTYSLQTSSSGKSIKLTISKANGTKYLGANVFGFYPRNAFGGKKITDNGGVADTLLVVSLAASQTAQAGNIAAGTMPTVAFSRNYSDDFAFHAAAAVLRFKLSCPEIDQVTAVEISNTGATLCGDITCHGLTTGGLTLSTTEEWPTAKVPHGKTVTLSGTFESGQYYYAAVAEGHIEGIKIALVNEDGKKITLSYNRDFDARAGVIYDLGTVATECPFPIDEFETYGVAAPNKTVDPIVFAVLGEGYTKAEQKKFHEEARAALDHLYSVEPYKTYRPWTSAYIIGATSKQSGASTLNATLDGLSESRNTAFGVALSQGFLNESANLLEKAVVNEEAVRAHLAKYLDEFQMAKVEVVLLVNDPRHARYAQWKGVDGATATFAIVCNTKDDITWNYPSTYNANASAGSDAELDLQPTVPDETLGVSHGDYRHLFMSTFGGFIVGRLWWEMWDGAAPKCMTDTRWTALGLYGQEEPCALNVSRYQTGEYGTGTEYWTELLTKRDELIAKDARYARIASEQGAGAEYAGGLWRSEKVSCMLDNRPYFSTLQRFLIAKRIFERGDERFGDLNDFILLDDPTDPVRNN